MSLRFIALICLFSPMVALGGAGCAAPDTDHILIVSVPDQKMLVLRKGEPLAKYPISTSRFGVGSQLGSYATPVGTMEIAKKIGNNAPAGAVFKDRRRTGEILPVDAPGRDPIVTRILWLRGLEEENTNTYARHIYIHGTPEEKNLGKPVSFGCIRMRSKDVVQLFDIVGTGARVEITERHLSEFKPKRRG